MRLAFRVSYIGDRFYGSQLQPDRRTVEGEFIKTCVRLDLFTDWRMSRFTFAGRTDRGVHARGQVCAFSTDHPQRAIEAINQCLPPDCWCTGWTTVDAEFHPRYHAKTRTYRYYFLEEGLDAAAMMQAARLFVGRHDFSCFAKLEDRSPVRTISCAHVVIDGDYVVFEVQGESFLWNMVRCMATALAAVGRGDWTEDEIQHLFDVPSGERLPASEAGGLVLWDVDCGLGFDEMDPGTKRTRFLEGEHRALKIKEKVLDELRGPRLNLGGQ